MKKLFSIMSLVGLLSQFIPAQAFAESMPPTSASNQTVEAVSSGAIPLNDEERTELAAQESRTSQVLLKQTAGEDINVHFHDDTYHPYTGNGMDHCATVGWVTFAIVGGVVGGLIGYFTPKTKGTPLSQGNDLGDGLLIGVPIGLGIDGLLCLRDKS